MSKITFTHGKAFVDLQPIQPSPGGTLHVIGTADAHNTNEAKLKKREPQGINPSILLLEIIELDFVPTENPQKVDYTEELNTTDQYRSVDIFVGDVKVATVDKIEIVR